MFGECDVRAKLDEKLNVRALQSAQFFRPNEFGCGDASDSVQRQNRFRLFPRAMKQIAHVRGEERNVNSISQLLRRIGTTEETRALRI